MKSFLKSIFVIAVFSIGLTVSLTAQDMVEESSTDKKFPREVTFSYDGTEYSLTVTGLAVRKKFIFKVYGIAHYMQDPQKMSKEEAFQAILTNDKAKQITMDFSRDVGADKIQGAYYDGFKKIANREEFAEIKPLVDQFVGFFDKEVKENEQYILRWLPGGTVISIVQGEEKPAISSETFARVLWSIWLGEDSIVDRDNLVEMMVAK